MWGFLWILVCACLLSCLYFNSSERYFEIFSQGPISDARACHQVSQYFPCFFHYFAPGRNTRIVQRDHVPFGNSLKHYFVLYTAFTDVRTAQIVSAPMNGFIFTTYRFFIRAQTGNKDVVPSLTQISIAGGCTGILLSYVAPPQSPCTAWHSRQLTLPASSPPLQNLSRLDNKI